MIMGYFKCTESITGVRFKILDDYSRWLPVASGGGHIEQTHQINYHAQVELIHMHKICFRGGNR